MWTTQQSGKNWEFQGWTVLYVTNYILFCLYFVFLFVLIFSFFFPFISIFILLSEPQRQHNPNTAVGLDMEITLKTHPTAPPTTELQHQPLGSPDEHLLNTTQYNVISNKKRGGPQWQQQQQQQQQHQYQQQTYQL